MGASLKYCPHCGAAINREGVFCANCGKAVAQPETGAQTIMEAPQTAAPEPQKGGRRKKENKGLAAVCCVLLVLFGAWAGFSLLVRHGFSDHSLDTLAQELDLAQLQVGFFSGEKNQTLVEYLVESESGLVAHDAEQTLAKAVEEMKKHGDWEAYREKILLNAFSFVSEKGGRFVFDVEESVMPFNQFRPDAEMLETFSQGMTDALAGKSPEEIYTMDSEELWDYILENCTEPVDALMEQSLRAKLEAGIEFALYSEEEMEELLESDFIRDFLADKLKDYAGDLLEGTGDGVVTGRELKKLLTKNLDVLEEITGREMTEESTGPLFAYLEDNEALESTALSGYMEGNAGFTLIRVLLSRWLQIVLVLLCVLLAVAVFLLRNPKAGALKALGASLTVLGVFYFLMGLLVSVPANLLNGSLALGVEFYQLLFRPMRVAGMVSGILTLLLGGILLAVGLVLCRKRSV